MVAPSCHLRPKPTSKEMHQPLALESLAQTALGEPIAGRLCYWPDLNACGKQSRLMMDSMERYSSCKREADDRAWDVQAGFLSLKSGLRKLSAAFLGFMHRTVLAPATTSSLHDLSELQEQLRLCAERPIQWLLTTLYSCKPRCVSSQLPGALWPKALSSAEGCALTLDP